MFPDACENCGLETDELIDIAKPEGFLQWFICKTCYRKLYQHEFYSAARFPDFCQICGKKNLDHDIHTSGEYK